MSSSRVYFQTRTHRPGHGPAKIKAQCTGSHIPAIIVTVASLIVVFAYWYRSSTMSAAHSLKQRFLGRYQFGALPRAQFNARIEERSGGEPLTLASGAGNGEQEVIYSNTEGGSGGDTPVAPRWGIVLLADEKSLQRYAHHALTIQCYAKKHGYRMIIDSNDPTNSSSCKGLENFFFRKHCRVAELMRIHSDIEWFTVLDGDTLVVNADTPLDYYLDHNQISADTFILHYERFHNGEIAAGNYMVRNTAAAMQYLMEWALFETDTLPNADNGALHVHILARIHSRSSEIFQKCRDRWAGEPKPPYLDFVGCVRCQLGGKRHFGDMGIIIMRRGHAFVRDFFVVLPGLMETDGDAQKNIGYVIKDDPLIFLHGWKDPQFPWYNNLPTNIDACDANWKPDLNPAMVVDQAAGREKMKAREDFAAKFPNSKVIADAVDCWPNCPPDLTPVQEAELKAKTC